MKKNQKENDKSQDDRRKLDTILQLAYLFRLLLLTEVNSYPQVLPHYSD